MLEYLTELWAADSGRFQGIASFATLLIVDIGSLVLLRCYRPGRRCFILAVLAGLCWAVWTQFFFALESATFRFWLGTPLIAVEQPGNPDPDTRYEQGRFHGGSLTDPRWSTWGNWAIFTNELIFGPSPRRYLGPYPTRDEAVDFLTESGEGPIVLNSQILLPISGANFPLCPRPTYGVAGPEDHCHWWCDHDDIHLDWGSICQGDVENGVILRAVALDDSAMLVETDGELQIRWWDGQYLGRLWAKWSLESNGN
jgi:hypothetical protein